MRTRHILFAGLMALTLIPACASEDTADIDSIEDSQEQVAESADDGKADARPSSFTYFTARRDFRRCVSPLCGGWWVKEVNQRYTYCPVDRGSDYTTEECYVAEVAFPADISLGNHGVLRGTLRSKRFGTFGDLHAFKASEVWQAAGNTPATGLFYRVNDTGIVCITYPCPTHKETKLNSYVAPVNIAGADLSGAGATVEDQDLAFEQMQATAGVLVAGNNVTVTGPAGRMRSLKATQFYLRVKAAPAAKKCYVGGCSSQVCSDRADVITTCEFRPEYACYRSATCAEQADGNCGWTRDAALTACLASPPTN